MLGLPKEAAKLFGTVRIVANTPVKSSKEDSYVNIDELVVKRVFVDQGPTLRRFRPELAVPQIES